MQISKEKNTKTESTFVSCHIRIVEKVKFVFLKRKPGFQIDIRYICKSGDKAVDVSSLASLMPLKWRCCPAI